ncbi:MAG: dephospho-CoA kinase [Euryarchaeota archaeon]|nr:dephospho-CoA kinase [Euryarchaeota archaeon]HIK01129.1 AAA family ATPase [Candidatus Undinarchaeales archaeon ERR594346 U_76725]|tara:strand:- start:24052 stop:24603 length:552 start_codon:yes stop_codon:yes gene_type:complete
MKKIIAVTGMPGAGKTLACEFAKERGYAVFYVGGLTKEELEKRGLEVNEANEREIRESLRKEFGMDVYAQKISEKIAASGEEIILLDGVRSFEEYEFLRNKYGKDFLMLSIVVSPDLRYERLMSREFRGLSKEDCVSRDMSEIRNINHGNTIAMGDYYIVNDGSDKSEFREKVNEVLNKLVES